MTAQTQTTSTGWYYADTRSSTNSAGWDGRLWPEITGYRGHELTVVDDIAVKEPPTIVEAAGVEAAKTETAKPKVQPKVRPPRLFEVIELKNAAAESVPNPEEKYVPAISEQVVETVAASKSPTRLYVALALALIAVALILGVAL